MDPGPNQNPPGATSPSASNASAHSSTAATITATIPIKKKPGRGPGKKDIKDRPTVSVRWDDGDLTERLISAVESNERWQGVFAQASNEPGQMRAAPPVAKRDLQREIARHLFQTDSRYDLEDRKVLESLAVRITTLYAECKQELGHISTFKDERDIPPGSDTWARVKDKFPQFFRIRDLMSKVPLPSTPRTEEPLSPVDHSSVRSRTVAPIMSGQIPQNTSSSLKGAVDLPREVRLTAPGTLPPTHAPVQTRSYVDPSNPIPSSYVPSAPSTTSSATVTSPSYPMQSPRLQTSTSYPQPQGVQRRMGSTIAVNPQAQPSSRAGGMPTMHHPQPQPYSAQAVASPTQMQRPSPYPRPTLSNIQPSGDPTMERAHPSHSPELQSPPSPPLSQTIQSIVTTLTERKDRERARAHELEVLRMKREEAERARWHQREMLRLRIKLIRAQRGSAMTTTPGAGSSTVQVGQFGTGGVEDDLAAVAGLGDDGMSLEGDGEGELDEEMFDPEPGSRPSQTHQQHHA
ncbi:hypothetical protein FRB99_002594 [Tulasnella sp. 403]|nr:hypothetical protein FRB99_002594 [Tulasnella sp. 403]